jgi:hypothetical protein
MRFSLSSLTVAAATVVALALGSSPAQATADNPYAGEWCGTFELVGDEDPAVQGTVELSISAAGQITGSFFNTTLEVGGTMHGHIDNDGTLNLNPNLYGTGPGGKGQNGEHHAGQAYIDGDGNLVAPTTGVWHGGYSVVAVLAPCD